MADQAETPDTTGYMSCYLKLDTSTPGWHKTLTKVLSKIKGVSYQVDAQAGIAVVRGTVEPDTLLKTLAKAGKHAELLTVDSGLKSQFYTAPMPVANANYRNGHGGYVGYGGYLSRPVGYGGNYGGGYYNNHDYGYYNHPTGSYAMADPYRDYYNSSYYPPSAPPPSSFPQPPPPMQMSSFYDPDAQCRIM